MKEWKITEGYKVKEGEVSWNELKRTTEKTAEERRPAHRIVALDGYGLNPGDLSWEKIEALGDFTVYDRTAVDEIVERAAEADIVLTNKTPLSAATLDKLPPAALHRGIGYGIQHRRHRSRQRARHRSHQHTVVQHRLGGSNGICPHPQHSQ